MSTKRNKTWGAAGVLAIVGLAGGTLAGAATFKDRATGPSEDSSVTPKPVQAIAPTDCGTAVGTIADPCKITLRAAKGSKSVSDFSQARVVPIAMGVGTLVYGSTPGSFTPADLGRMVSVAGAGAGGADLVTTIANVAPDGSSVDLTLAGSTAVPVGTMKVADVKTVDFWGFNLNGHKDGAVSTDPDLASANNAIKVPQGTVVQVTLTNDLPAEAGSLKVTFPSLPGLVTGTEAANAGSSTFTFTASTVGTSIYEAGDTAQGPRQVAMGLAGALIVTPTTGIGAYGTDAAYHDEALVALSDIDAEFAADPINADSSYYAQPKANDATRRLVYHFINGKSFPDTDVIDVQAGTRTLLRYVNASVKDKTMGILGVHQTLLARNANAYPDPQTAVAPLIGPGETADTTVDVPAGAVKGQKYSLMEQGRMMNKLTPYGFGGALTFLDVWSGAQPAAPALVAPLTYDGTTLHGTATPTGGATITAIVYTVGSGPATEVPSTATIALPIALNVGDVISVQAKDNFGQLSNTVSYTRPAPNAPTVTALSYDFGTTTLKATATADAGLTITALQYSVGSASGPWTSFPGFVAGASVTLTDTTVTATDTTIYVQATDSGSVSTVGQLVIPKAPIVTAGYNPATQTLTAGATLDGGATIATARYRVAPAVGYTAFALPALTATPVVATGTTIDVQVTDSLGRTTTTTITVAAAPTLTAAWDGTTLTGTATAAVGTTITGVSYVLDGGTPLPVGTVQPDGSFTEPVAAGATTGIHTVEVVATASDGQTSAPVSLSVTV